MKAHAAHRRPAILVVGAEAESSGFARVIRHVVDRASLDNEIHHFAIDREAPGFDRGAIRVHPTRRTREDPYGLRQLQTVAASVRPRLMLVVHDLWYQARYLQALEPFAGECKVVTYTPIDGDVPHCEWLAPLRHVDRCVFYTEYGRRNVESFLPEWRTRGNTLRNPAFDVIPHGVDTATFYPLGDEGRRAARKALFPEQHLDDAFIVLNANRPTPRKRIDVTLAGFARFARDKPANVKLYLHHTMVTPRLRAQVYEAAQTLGIRDRLLVNPLVDGKAEVCDERLNLVYNACDVGINTAMGEGWGLVSLEHAASGAAQVVPRHTACGEIWNGAAELLDPVDEGSPWFTPFRMYLVSADDLAGALERLYHDPAYRRQMAEAAYRRATRPEYGWRSISDRWAGLFREVLAE